MSGIRTMAPAHPGGFVKTEVIELLGLSDTAADIGVTRALPALANACRRKDNPHR